MYGDCCPEGLDLFPLSRWNSWAETNTRSLQADLTLVAAQDFGSVVSEGADSFAMRKGDSSVGDESTKAEAQLPQKAGETNVVLEATQDALENLSRKRKEEHTTRLSELEELSDTVRQEEALSTEEKQRQMSIIYSRRKRVRQSQKLDELTETCVAFREQNDQLRADNARLEELLAKADELAKTPAEVQIESADQQEKPTATIQLRSDKEMQQLPSEYEQFGVESQGLLLPLAPHPPPSSLEVFGHQAPNIQLPMGQQQPGMPPMWAGPTTGHWRSNSYHQQLDLQRSNLLEQNASSLSMTSFGQTGDAATFRLSPGHGYEGIMQRQLYPAIAQTGLAPELSPEMIALLEQLQRKQME